MTDKKRLSRREFLGRIGVTAAGVTATGVTGLLPSSAETAETPPPGVTPPPSLIVSAQLLPVYSTPSPAPIEDSTNQDGPVVWASVFQGPDRKIYSVGGSNHNSTLANSVRCFNPASERCELPFANITGRYVNSYDNHPSMLHYSDAKLVWYNHGVFDLVQKTWVYGNLPPTVETTGQGYVLNSTVVEQRYNPAAAWCPGLNMGVFWSGSSGNAYAGLRIMATITRNPNYPSQPQPWVAKDVPLPSLPDFGYGRNNAVCVGTNLYLGGGIVLGRVVTGAAVGVTQLTIKDPTGVEVGARLYFYDVTAKTYVRAVSGNVLTVDPLPKLPSGSYTPGAQMSVFITHNGFYRLDLTTISTTQKVVRLANWPESVEILDPPVTLPTATRTNYPQLVYDSARNRFVLLGRTVWTYDITSNTWTNVTPTNWVPRDQVMGAYDRVNDAIYFRGLMISATGSVIKQDAYTWRKLKFSDAPGPVITSIPLDLSQWPIVSGAKHCRWAYVPKKYTSNALAGLVMQAGGDFNSGNKFGQAGDGANPLLPDGTHAYVGNNSPFPQEQGRMDCYAFDPRASTIAARLVFPLIRPDIGTGGTHVPATAPMKACEPWFWQYKGELYFYSEHNYSIYDYFTTGSNPRTLNVWANGDVRNPKAGMLNNNHVGVYKFTGKAGGGIGSWSLVVDARMYDSSGAGGISPPGKPPCFSVDGKTLFRSETVGPDYPGVVFGAPDEKTGRVYGIGLEHIYAFNHNSLRFEYYRHGQFSEFLAQSGGAYRFFCAGSNVACIDGFLYHVAEAVGPIAFGSVRRSLLVRIDLAKMIAKGDTYSDPTITSFYDTPFDIGTDNTSTSAYGQGQWVTNGIRSDLDPRYCKIAACLRRVALLGSYMGMLQPENSVARYAVFDHDDKSWVPVPQNIPQLYGNVCVSVEEDEGFVLFGESTVAPAPYPRMNRFRIR